MSTESFTKQIIVKPNDKQLLELLGVSTMTIEEIRANAPYGTTHYQEMPLIGRVFYYQKLNGIIYWFNDCDFWSSVLREDGMEFMKKLRSKIKPLY